MSTSTALTITNEGISLLQGYLTQAFTSLFPTVLGIVVLFAGIYVLKTLWHRRV